LLKDPDRRVRQFTLSTLGELADASVMQAIIDTLNDEDSSVRQRAAYVLGKLGDYRALRALQAINGHETDRDVRLSAIRAIHRIKEQTTP
jgi:HEAT repeat protein